MKEKFNVLHIIDNSGVGGAQSILYDIINQRYKNYYFFILRKHKVNLIKKERNVYFSSSNKKYNFFVIFDLIKVIRKKKITCIHTHLLKSNISGLILKRIFFPKIKLVFHEHGKIFSYKKFSHKIHTFILNNFQDTFDSIIAISKTTEKMLLRYAKLSKQKIKVIPNPISEKFMNIKVLKKDLDLIKNEYKLKDKFIVGYIGRMTYRKGCQFLIKAIAKLSIKNLRLIMIGDGIYKKELKKLVIKLNLEKKVLFLGSQDRVSIRTFINLMDILCIPSLWEPFGIVTLEGLATKTPIVASDIDGISEILTHNYNAYLTKPQKVKQIRKGIQKILKDSKYKNKIVLNGLKTVKKYKLSLYIEKVNDLYLDIKNKVR